MAGKIKKQLSEIIANVSKGSPILKNTVRTKLILRGLNPEKFDDNSPDDPVLMEKIQTIAKEFNITLRNF